MRLFLVLLGGALFGSGLVISGMTDPARVIGFLDLFGDWDPALAFVMGGAVVTFGIALIFLKKSNTRLCGTKLPDLSADPVSGRMIVGSAIFGVGWGLGGFCPGPALANLAALRMESLIFVPFMIIGMVIAQRIFQLDQ